MAQTNLLNTTWTLHRLSPLHHGKEFESLLDNPVALKTYATRLRDQLTGASFPAAVQSSGPLPAAEDDALSRTGALQSCTWEPIPNLSFSEIEDEHNPENESRPPNPPRSRARTQRLPPSLSPSHQGGGILVKLEYENTTYKAALLTLSSPKSPPEPAAKPRARTRSQTQTHATRLPLLLTRFPAPLRQTFISFLSSTFDTYCSALCLPSQFIGSALITYINTLASEGELGALNPIDILKELHLTLSFPTFVAPDLRSLNITIPRESLRGFLRAEGGGAGSESDVLSILSAYLEEHLAMKVDLSGASPVIKGHEHVRLAKIACGGFLLGGEGRLKLAAAPSTSENGESDGATSRKNRLALRACEMLLSDVVHRAVVDEDEGQET
ncbi:hypothetical protein BO78DRAFT_225001 [Aspergillus sclerotiicarbonarius CBS 121057]|uniref:Uncharacterized protein n=1 Tax=Aspergillus sclerotiicarbonarius (strain CBS 121057 / IBT 28362) TaxID=1448318 RepID=A0A319DWP7_ASPSB|nr:hypothetical protein BO78DRAFT_225001 [Aspergillus sclerotiicarbonarius CBS 121057]